MPVAYDPPTPTTPSLLGRTRPISAPSSSPSPLLDGTSGVTVAGLSEHVTDRALKRLFEPYGRVLCAGAQRVGAASASKGGEGRGGGSGTGGADV